MSDITYHGVDIGLLEGGENLVERLLTVTTDVETNVDLETDVDPPMLQDDDVLVVSSKVVSLAEGRFVDLDRVPVSPASERIADATGIDPREVELIRRESTVLGAIPVAEIGADRLRSHAADPEGADEALESLPSLLVTNWNGRLCTNAGIDLSNSPAGTATLLPADPDESARRIREEIRERTGVDVAVVIADSELSHRGGSVDVAIGCAGIDPVDSNFGATDLFDTPKLGGVDLLADELAAGAAVLSGQADERLPIVVVRGVDYDHGGGIDADTDMLRRRLWPTLGRTVRVKLAEVLPLPSV